jgi:4-hydroxythreonine-4-phosphate dehydrogenase
VTGPIHKARLAREGFAYTGHTDMLGAICGVERPVMAFVGGTLRVVLVTTHVPLSEVPSMITAEAVGHVVRTAARALRDDLGLAAPRIGVCGLNPHAGEGGLLGDTEAREIAPACEALRAEGWDLGAPISAETAFMEAHAGRLDLVVAMYHDQGLVPLKMVDFGRSVNWTLGLPIIRTSVDHGTADDLVGTGRADASSMAAAIGLARRLAGSARATPCP